MPRLALTDRFVAGAKAGKAPQTDYFDARRPASPCGYRTAAIRHGTSFSLGRTTVNVRG